jgi:putrescine transport system permease protein
MGASARSSFAMKRNVVLTAMLVLGFVFLYVPIAVLVVYSFNANRLVTVWGGWSLRWYAALFHDAPLIRAAWLSVRLAFVTGVASAVLGTLAGIALGRRGGFAGRRLFATMIGGPIVLPDVVLGLALLLLFVAVQSVTGFPAQRGALTIVLAHTTFGLCYVALIVQARFLGLDRALEEAAMDLGARPFKVLTTITVPLLAPAVLAGFLLAFTLSLDDLVIASFVSGPGATTLPMAVFSAVRLGVKPEVNALATLLIVIVAVAVIGVGASVTSGRRVRFSAE